MLGREVTDNRQSVAVSINIISLLKYQIVCSCRGVVVMTSGFPWMQDEAQEDEAQTKEQTYDDDGEDENDADEDE
ncbi:hypothetical protein N7453_011372 [Penicillium expansum]|nr:hypothetical protein N7453_011372 [Penicillium expansum]